MTQVSHYIGLDLGKPSEFSALAIPEGPQRGLLPKGEDLIYSLRHLKRWEPGTAYPIIATQGTQLAGGRFWATLPCSLIKRALGAPSWNSSVCRQLVKVMQEQRTANDVAVIGQWTVRHKFSEGGQRGGLAHPKRD